MVKLAIRLTSLVVLLTVFAGCAQMQQAKKTIQMQDQTNAYRKAIRWSEYEIAVTFVRRRDGSSYSYDEDFYDRIRVVDMEIQNREVFEADGIAIVTSKIEFYHVDDNSVKSLSDRQTWWFEEDSERWFLDGRFPDYAAELGY